jgi:hypothetical protein
MAEAGLSFCRYADMSYIKNLQQTVHAYVSCVYISVKVLKKDNAMDPKCIQVYAAKTTHSIACQ